MPIAIHDDSKTLKLIEEPFQNELELQTCIARSPFLLASGFDALVATVQREVGLPGAGSLDILNVDEMGLPIAVEVKLARNPQSRREVVAQVLDYVSVLKKLTIDELDDIVKGALTETLQKLVGPERVMSVRKKCGMNLRAGHIRFVIAVDSAGEDLVRNVQNIADRDDVRLVCISKFDKGRILVPHMLVGPANRALAAAPARVTDAKEMNPIFSAVIDAYDRVAEEGWKTHGNAAEYRLISPSEWPKSVHYEFGDYQKAVGVELHLESDRVSGLAKHLAPLSGKELAPDLTVNWDPKWYGKRGRLVAKVDKEQKPDAAVRAMQALMSITRSIIERNLP
ncbi:MAG: DUF91 domain-containing protein [Verrucomicrobia bacterium]|nr:DUF91 domain-containing protein [Verrucomicrobiota bacterium]